MSDKTTRQRSPSPVNDEEEETSVFGVYISDVARGTSEEVIKEEFSKIAPVHSVYLVKDKSTGETKGFGFLYFFNKEDSERILRLSEPIQFRDTITNKLIPIKISRADPKNVLYISGWPKSLSHEQLKKAIEEVGEMEVKLFEVRHEDHKTYALATFENHAASVTAMKRLQTTPIYGFNLFVCSTEPKVLDDKRTQFLKKLMFKNFPRNIRETDVRKMIGDEVIDRMFFEDVYLSGSERGNRAENTVFVHIEFKEKEDAVEALKKFNGYYYDQAKLEVEWDIAAKPVKNSQKNAPSGPRNAPRTGRPKDFGGRGDFGKGGALPTPNYWKGPPSGGPPYYGPPGMAPPPGPYPPPPYGDPYYNYFHPYYYGMPPNAPPGRGGYDNNDNFRRGRPQQRGDDKKRVGRYGSRSPSPNDRNTEGMDNRKRQQQYFGRNGSRSPSPQRQQQQGPPPNYRSGGDYDKRRQQGGKSEGNARHKPY